MKLLLTLILCLLARGATATVYLAPEDFVAQSFASAPVVQTLWLSADAQAIAKKVLGHRYQGLRVRYWVEGERSLWILDEIGKEKPITVGVVIEGDAVASVSILAFRESRGWEVRHPFFTAQFARLRLAEDFDLTGPIDGISGATLSVHAVTNVTRFALYLHGVAMTERRLAEVRAVDG